MKITQSPKLRGIMFRTALLVGLGFATHAVAQERPYLIDLNSKTVTALGSLGDLNTYPTIYPTALNDAQQVVGYFGKHGGDYHPFITDSDGVGVREIRGPVPFDWWSGAPSINNAGQVVGTHSPGVAYITGPNGVGIRDLGSLGGNWSFAFGINDAAQVVGSSGTANGASHAFITGPDGAGMRDLGTLGGESVAYAINNTGQVVGYSHLQRGEWHAFITGANGEGMRDLGTLGGNFSKASGINEAGQVVGYSETSEGSWHAFITGPDGVGMRDLGTLKGDFSEATGINDAGQVVGSHSSFGAFITGSNGVGMRDLDTLVDLPEEVLFLTGASDINNAGRVIVAAQVVPEPETYVMLLGGLGLIGWIARRKKMEADAERHPY